jgi:O-antigen/teichoic acid export membrane protein
LILGIFEPSDQVGIYRIAVQISMLAAFGLHAVNMVVTPRFAELYMQNRLAPLKHLVVAGGRVAQGFTLLVTVGFLLVGKPCLRLIFGPVYTASYLPIVILLIGQMVNSATGSVGNLLNMTGYERETLRGTAVAAAIGIALDVLLIPVWGIRGAATATAVSMAIWKVLLWWAARKHLHIDSLAYICGDK